MPQHFQYQYTTAHFKERKHSLPTINKCVKIWRSSLTSCTSKTKLQQQRSLSLPPKDIPTFDGDRPQNRAFIKAFEQRVTGKAGKADCLYYLEQFIRGQPRELVHSCQHTAPQRGYAVAKDLLQKHSGNPHKTATAYTEKALVCGG